MIGKAPSLSARSSDADRYASAQRITWISAAVNVVLTAAQVAVGFIAHSQSLIADGMHSASDLFADFLVLYANRRGSHPADDAHPYGHGRIETAASLILGLGLAGTGAALLLAAGSRLQHIDQLPDVRPLALWMALATLVAKEGLFRYMLGVAVRLRSPMLVANAWHARADAASSLVVAVGIGGSLMGYRFLDLLAAAIVGFMILRMGFRFAYDALRELVDTALSGEEVGAIRACLLATPGVLDLHGLRTRRMGHKALVDAHVRVDPRITVSEGHRIAELARARVLESRPDVLDVLVHVDAEDDAAGDRRLPPLPDRSELTRQVAEILGPDVPHAERTLLHFLGDRVEAEVFLPPAYCADPARVRALEQRIRLALAGHRFLAAIYVNCRVAPR